MEPAPSNEDTSRRRTLGALRFEALASGFVALLALLISAYTVYVQRQQLKVQAWPRLTLVSDNQPGASASEFNFTLSLKNRGVAPAEVRAMRVGFNGEDVRDWVELFVRLKKKHGIGGGLSLSKGASADGEIVGVGEQLPLLATTSARTAATLAEALEEVSISVCYCSVLDDCWVLEAPGGEIDSTTTPRARCPAYPTKFVGFPREADKQWADRVLSADARAPTDPVESGPEPK